MSNGYSNINPTVTIESLPVYSASFAAAKTAPVSAVFIAGLPEDSFSLELAVECTAGGEKIFSFEKKYEKINCRLFNYENSNKICIKFEYSDFFVDTGLLCDIISSTDAEIIVKASVDGKEHSAKSAITLAAADEWQGISLHPETLFSFILPNAPETTAIADGLENASEFTPFAEQCETIGEIIKRIRSKHIICTTRDGYSPEKKQIISPIDKLLGKSTVLASPAELAVLFCSAALRLKLKPIIAFVKNNIGVVSVFCGIASSECYDFVITESISKIRKAIDDSDMLLFDPAILSSAQSIDVDRAGTFASEILHRNGTDMLLALNADSGTAMGVSPLFFGTSKETVSQKYAKSALVEIYTGLTGRKTFRMLGGDYSPFSVLPLIGFDAGRCASAFSEAIPVRPMAVNESIAEFAGMADNFASFALKDTKQKDFNKSELAETAPKYEDFVGKIKAKNYVTAGMYEKQFREQISRICFGTVPGMSNYMICGFIRLTDAESGETTYFPIAFAEAEIICGFDYSVKLSDRRLIINTVLASYLARRDEKYGDIDTLEKAFALFEYLAEKAKNGGEFSDASVIREFALIKADFSEFALWNDIRLFGKDMLSNKNFSAIISSTPAESEQTAENSGFVFPRFSEEKINSLLRSGKNAVICGTPASEIADAAVNKTAMAVNSGKSVIVSSRNPDFSDNISEELAKIDFSDLTLRLDKKTTASELSALMNERLAKAREIIYNPSGEIATEFDKAAERIENYAELLSKTDDVLGITLSDAVLSFYRSCDAPNGETVDIIPTSEKAFKNMTQHKFNKLFECAEKLISTAKKAQNAVGLHAVSPLTQNPLYPITSPCSPDENKLGILFDIIAKINSVAADYRETFFAIKDDLGIDVSDIKDINGLYSLNELYKIIISARELEIPDNFSENDFSDFADGADRLGRQLSRTENIEYRLSFFSKEIFEDIDSVLSGYDVKDGGQGGFIKKFLVRKNNKDVLLQYVPAENKNEFYRHDVEEVFKLLEEYRTLKASTSASDERYSTENSIQLAELIKNTENALCGIYGDIDDGEKSKKALKIFSFIKKVSRDSSISKKLTYARAKLAQVYSENECLLAELSNEINADFSVLKFENGILDYSGLTHYLKELEKNLPAISYWSGWLEAKSSADEYFPEFAMHIENNGIKENTDRAFAASLILPSIGYLIEKYDVKKHKKNFDGAKSNYAELYEKARTISLQNTKSAYLQRLKHFAETESFPSLESDGMLSLYDFVSKYKSALFTVFPIIFINPEEAGAFFGCERTADVLIADAGSSAEYCQLSAASCADEVLVLKYGSKSALAGKLLSAGTDCAEISYRLYPVCRQLSELCENAEFYYSDESEPKISVITVNGVMRRTRDMANPAEAEVCVTKAADIAAKTDMSVGIFALTFGQHAYISHLLSVVSQNDNNLKNAIDSGRIIVAEPGKPNFKKTDCAIISLGAASDSDGNIGWNFGAGTPADRLRVLKNAAQSTAGRVMIISSLSSKDLTRLEKSGYEAEMLYYVLFGAQNKYVPMKAGTFDGENSELAYMMISEADRLSPAVGRFSLAADAVSAGGTAYLYTCGASVKVFDRLYAEQSIDGCKAFSMLDRVLSILYPETNMQSKPHSAENGD